MFKRKDKALSHAYAEIVATFRRFPDATHRMHQGIVLPVKQVIDENFTCTKACEYRTVLYDALLDQGQIPIKPATGKPYKITDTSHLRANKTNPNVEFVRSLNNFYQGMRKNLKEYKRPDRSFKYSPEALHRLMCVAPHDVKWFQMVSELEDYAIRNDVFNSASRCGS